jgi:hypothetical protein
MSADATSIVPALLAAAGIQPAPGEVARMIEEYPARAQQLARLHAVPEARYEEPGLIFDAAAFS